MKRWCFHSTGKTRKSISIRKCDSALAGRPLCFAKQNDAYRFLRKYFLREKKTQAWLADIILKTNLVG